MKKGRRLWFRAKYYGWGWYPVTWEGWVVLLTYILYVVDRSAESKKLFEIFFATILLIIICYLTGEKPRWRWGKK